MRRWLPLAGAITAEVSATMALRASVDQSAWIPLVVVGYLVAFVLLTRTLRAGVPIGVAYGIWGAAGVALVAGLGAVIFDETLSVAAVGGIGLIVVGIVLVESGARRSGTPESEDSGP